ncbi:T9SS type A sorting domain-containing protein [Edaphocola flava]|jgi:hypothetical protein|uniref:T9SS type A sorting domain-containing protein n=1 Tax=Edaphocola flava TaxID=2499629 RepID=UPI00100B1720|nr:T9SS type A sorting domain-containing protein [Edaphocola flava]
MKKVFTLLCAGFGIGLTSASAQVFELARPTMTASTPGYAGSNWDDGAVKLINYVRNLGAAPITDLKWQIVEKNFPFAWTLYTFCDNETCLTEGQIPQYITSPKTFQPIAVGDSSLFEPAFKIPTTADNGVGTLKVRVYNNAQSDTGIFIVTKTPTGINTIKVNDNRVTVYPNPAVQDDVTIFVNKDLKAKYTKVYNVIGAEVAVANINGELAQINTAAFAKGTYIVQVVAADGSLVATRKLIKN